MFLSGVNIGGFFSQTKEFSTEHLKSFITEEDIDRIKKWGFELIRLPIDYFFFESDDQPFQYKEERLKLIDKVVDWTQERDIYLILDLHKAPGHTFEVREKKVNDLWEEGTDSRKRFLAIWNMLSKRFSRSDKVMYEPMNEPTAPESKDWYQLLDKTIETIRKNDTNHYIVVESNMWATAGTFNEMKKYDDEKILYSFHFYEPHIVTHQLAEWVPFVYENIYRKKVPYPGKPQGLENIKEKMEKVAPHFAQFFEDQGKEWDKQELINFLKPVIDFKEKYPEAPLFCGEFGVNVKADPETRRNWLKDLIAILKEYKISYAYWSYKNMDFGIVDYTKQYENNPNYTKDRLDVESLKILQNGMIIQ